MDPLPAAGNSGRRTAFAVPLGRDSLDTSCVAQAELIKGPFTTRMGHLMFGSVKYSRGVWFICAALLLLQVGCGMGEYNRLMKRNLGAMRSESKFRNLYAPTQLPGTPISIRVPRIYSQSYQADSAHNDDGPAINPDRLQPPFLRLPGFKLCYEGSVLSGADKLPHYCYLAAVPSQPGDADKLANQLQAQLNETFPEATVSWEPVDAPTPSGFSVHWRKLRLEGEQPFLVKTGDLLAPKTLPGIFELWIHDAGQYVVLVAWRTPKSIEGPSPVAAPSGDVFNAPTDGKPDLNQFPTLTAGSVSVEAAPDPARG